jgi:hypothetical protein
MTLTPRAIREANEREALIEAAPDDLQDAIREGRLEVLPGQKGKPVVRDAQTKRIVKGSGRPLRANDPASVGSKAAVRRSNSYREAVEQMISLIPGGEGKKTFEDLFDVLWDAIEGSPQTLECKSCGEKNVYYMKKDAATAFKLYENLVGKARETKDINVEGTQLTQILERRTVDVHVHGVDRNNVSAKRAALEVAFVDERDSDVPPVVHDPDGSEEGQE